MNGYVIGLTCYLGLLSCIEFVKEVSKDNDKNTRIGRVIGTLLKAGVIFGCLYLGGFYK